MAKLPALVTALAKVDGRERKVIDHIARTIRELGYISTGKRGGGAAEMTSRDAANLLIAMNGADTPKECPLAIDRFRSLRQAITGNAKTIGEYVESYDRHIEPIQGVMDSQTFGEAMEALFDGVPALVSALRNYSREAYCNKSPEALDGLFFGMVRLRLFGLNVTFQRYSANVELFTMNGSERRVEFEAIFGPDPARMESGFYGREWPDRQISVTIGTPTLIAAWQAMHPGESLPGIPDASPEVARDSIEAD